MKPILSNKFREYTFGDTQLFLAGHINMPEKELARQLAKGSFPDSIRGNFAFVFKGNGKTFAAVDHLCTVPLFYTQNTIGNVFSDVKHTLSCSSDNHQKLIQRQLLGGQTLGLGTTVNEIERICPGHYLHNGQQYEYLNLCDYQETTDQTETIANCCNLAITQLAETQNSLLMSAGTDSTALAAAMQQNHIPCEFVHVYSENSVLSEAHHAKRISQEMGLNTVFHHQAVSGDILPNDSERQYSFWIENPFSAKKAAIIEGGYSRNVFNGEVGDQLFGGPKNNTLLYYATQAKQINPEYIANIWINQSATYGRSHAFVPDPHVASLVQSSEGNAAKQEIVDYIADVLNNSNMNSLVKKFMLLNLMIKGPYRVWAYSQDSDINWKIPFAEWKVVDAALQLTEHAIYAPDGRDKSVFRKIWVNTSNIPWELAKHGFGIPAKSKYR